MKRYTGYQLLSYLATKESRRLGVYVKYDEAQAEIDDQEDTISEAEDLIKQHWTDLQTAQAEIDALVDMLEEMLYSNSTKYREKASELVATHRGKG